MARADLTLLELFATYPGGVVALSTSSGLSRSSIYRVGWARHGRPPIKCLSRLAAPLGMTLVELRRRWTRERASAVPAKPVAKASRKRARR